MQPYSSYNDGTYLGVIRLQFEVLIVSRGVFLYILFIYSTNRSFNLFSRPEDGFLTQ